MIYIGLWPIFFAVEFVLALWHGWLEIVPFFCHFLELILLNLIQKLYSHIHSCFCRFEKRTWGWAKSRSSTDIDACRRRAAMHTFQMSKTANTLKDRIVFIWCFTWNIR
jgi:hypothetical protein